MRPIHGDDFQFVGEELRLYGRARRLIERLARRDGRGQAHQQQVANGLVSGMRQGLDVEADLLRISGKLRRLFQKGDNQ